MKKICSFLAFLIISSLFLLHCVFIKTEQPGGEWILTATIPGQPAKNGCDPQIAIDCSGNAIAVWADYNGPVWSSYRPAGENSDWINTATIPGQSGEFAAYSRIQIAIDCSGNATAIWGQGSSPLVWSSYRPAGENSDWINTASIPGQSGDITNVPQIAIDCSGNAIAVWEDSAGPVWSSYRPAGQTSNWINTAAIPGQLGEAASKPQIAIDCSGNAIAIWRQGSPTLVWSSYRPAGENSDWIHTASIPGQPSESANDPQIAIDCSGNAIAVWEDSAGPVWSSYRPAGQNSDWINTALIPGQSGELAIDPQIAIDCSGNAIAVWADYDGPVWSSYRPAGQNSDWINTATIPGQSGETLTYSKIQIAIDCGGNAIAVWKQGSSSLIWSSYRPGGQNSDWINTAAIPGQPAEADDPQIAIDCSGNAIAVWEQGAADKCIWSSYFDAVPAPSNIRTGQEFHRFPTQADLINVLRWDPVQHDYPIVKYKIYCTPYKKQTPCCENCCDCKIRCCVCPCVNAQLIGEVPASGPLVFCHHNRCCGQRLTYCLTAVDTNGKETPVRVSVNVPSVS